LREVADKIAAKSHASGFCTQPGDRPAWSDHCSSSTSGQSRVLISSSTPKVRPQAGVSNRSTPAVGLSRSPADHQSLADALKRQRATEDKEKWKAWVFPTRNEK